MGEGESEGRRDVEEFGDISTIADPTVVKTLLETAADAA